MPIPEEVRTQIQQLETKHETTVKELEELQNSIREQSDELRSKQAALLRELSDLERPYLPEVVKDVLLARGAKKIGFQTLVREIAESHFEPNIIDLLLCVYQSTAPKKTTPIRKMEIDGRTFAIDLSE